MRTIKFRIWYELDKKYVWFGNPFESLNSIYSGYNPELFIYEQFTGFYDKNGKEIYEGDEISFNVPLNNYLEDAGKEYKSYILQGNARFYFYWPYPELFIGDKESSLYVKKNKFNKDLWYTADNIEVITNLNEKLKVGWKPRKIY